MKILCKKTLTGVGPTDDAGVDALKRFKLGEHVWIEVRKSRNPKFHRLYFALLNLTYSNQEQYTNFEMFRKAVQIAAGHVDELITLEGEVLLQPKSIAFDQLDELGFHSVFSETMKVCARLLGNLDLHELELEVLRAA
jgi:hypothetical protein